MHEWTSASPCYKHIDVSPTDIENEQTRSSKDMHIDNFGFLRLLQLADSALPIGSTAHSFGLETLVSEGGLRVEQLEHFLHNYLSEMGRLESVFCRLGYRLAPCPDMHLFQERWSDLNNHLSAMKPARESRVASATLGRRFLQLVYGLEVHPLLQYALQTTKGGGENHYSIAFGLVGGILDISEDMTVLAHLQQSLTALVSACQRLLPLGQQQASTILWRLKPTLIAIAQRSEEEANHPDTITIFTPLADIGSMRHPMLETRLFIS